MYTTGSKSQSSEGHVHSRLHGFLIDLNIISLRIAPPYCKSTQLNRHKGWANNQKAGISSLSIFFPGSKQHSDSHRPFGLQSKVGALPICDSSYTSHLKNKPYTSCQLWIPEKKLHALEIRHCDVLWSEAYHIHVGALTPIY